MHLCVEELQRKTDTLKATFTSCLYAFGRRGCRNWHTNTKLVLVLGSRRSARDISVFLVMRKACLYVFKRRFSKLKFAEECGICFGKIAAMGYSWVACNVGLTE